jgi:hypothetical protein
MKLALSSGGRLNLLVAVTVLVCLNAAPASAQVYSVNAVGYVDVNLAAGSNLVANPLNAGDNSISNLFRAVPAGSLYYPQDPASPDSGTTPRFDEAVGWVPGSAQLPGGAGAFLWLPQATRVSYVGEPWLSTLSSCARIPAGESVSAIWPLLSCGGWICPDPPCSAVPPDGFGVARWDPARQQFLAPIIYIDGFGWLGSDLDISEPRLAPGEAALFLSPSSFWVRAPGNAGMTASVQIHGPRRAGADFSFRFQAQSAVSYSLLRCSNLASNAWETIATQAGPPGGGWVDVADPAATNAACFYRLDCLRLFNSLRSGSTFSFQFHAQEGVSYHVRRKTSLTDPGWVMLLTLTGPSGGGVVTATDLNATNSTGYYSLDH